MSRKLHNDEIGEITKAYNQMAETLNQYSKKEAEIQKQLRENNWIKDELAAITALLQKSNHLKQFSKHFIAQVSMSVKANFSVLYIKNEKNSFEKVASYGDDLNGIEVKQRFQQGVGLVGQCATSKEMIILDKLPADYIKITSGLGEAEPTYLIVAPIIFDEEVIGVLELAKFTPYCKLEIKLIEKICDAIGITVNRILDHMKIQQLLEESQTLTEELQTQSEELKQQQEELQIVNDELYEKNRSLEEKKNELELAKKDLEETNRMIQLNSTYKSQFLANMSHELRTPLNSMIILSQTLLENSEENLTNSQLEYIETIHQAGNELLELINDILDLSKIESGKLEIHPEQVSIEAIVQFVKRQFTPIARNKKIDFQVTIDHLVPSMILTDEHRLKQILNNLLANAFKFTEEGNVKLHIKMSNDRTKVIFSISDTGIGIEKSKLSRVFEDFYQADSTTSRKYGGTGLGLPISKELAHLLNGDIKVESIEGKGSNFSLYIANIDDSKFIELVEDKSFNCTDNAIQTTSVELDEETIEVEQKNELKNKVVLIVDDDMRNVFALTAALEKKQLQTLFAENGKEALEILEKNEHIDIVLMDIMMPEMDGYETMREIRKQERYRDLPIIALTAKAMKNDREKCIQAGASDYISKPVNIDQLISLMKVWLYKFNQ